MKYLYGASVQGIQKFIFETGKLKEIIGASEIVERICTIEFEQFIDSDKVKIIQKAAGNIRLLAIDKKNLEKTIRSFPKFVLEYAPGIDISQAVVECDEKVSQKNFIELENKLKIQRNKPIRPTEITAMGIERSRRTGKSAIAYDNEKKLIDNASNKKINESPSSTVFQKIWGGEKKLFPLAFKNIINKRKSTWLAVIHADGNSLGKTIQTIFKDSNNLEDDFKKFSNKLNEATIEAAKEAFNNVIYKDFENNKLKPFPFRPIILGGDDLTIICRADLAIPFIKEYLTKFEKNTEELVGKKLTACAGIAFIKEKYPFHYAIELAEELCGVAKSASKKIDPNDVPASIMFHKVKSSFVDDFNDLKKRELFAKASNIKFDYGPYFIEGKPTIDNLLDKVSALREKDAPKSGLRRLISELNNDKESAKQLLTRIIQITKSKFTNGLELEKELKNLHSDNSEQTTIIYDLLTLLSLEGGK